MGDRGYPGAPCETGKRTYDQDLHFGLLFEWQYLSVCNLQARPVSLDCQVNAHIQCQVSIVVVLCV